MKSNDFVQNLSESCQIMQNHAESCRIRQNQTKSSQIRQNQAESSQIRQNQAESVRIRRGRAPQRCLACLVRAYSCITAISFFKMAAREGLRASRTMVWWLRHRLGPSVWIKLEELKTVLACLGIAPASVEEQVHKSHRASDGSAYFQTHIEGDVLWVTAIPKRSDGGDWSDDDDGSWGNWTNDDEDDDDDDSWGDGRMATSEAPTSSSSSAATPIPPWRQAQSSKASPEEERAAKMQKIEQKAESEAEYEPMPSVA